MFRPPFCFPQPCTAPLHQVRRITFLQLWNVLLPRFTEEWQAAATGTLRSELLNTGVWLLLPLSKDFIRSSTLLEKNVFKQLINVSYCACFVVIFSADMSLIVQFWVHIGQCIASNKRLTQRKDESLSFMWGNEVQSWELVFEVVQQCVCWGWVGSLLSRLGCCRSATRRVSLTAQAFVLNQRCSHRYATLLWSSGQLNHSQVTHCCDYGAQSCSQEDVEPKEDKASASKMLSYIFL